MRPSIPSAARTFLVISTTVCASLLVHAQAGADAEETAALGGLDPVYLCSGKEVAGSPKLAFRHGRFVYHFGDADSRRRFLADPERWAIQWGGGCARMGPLSGAGDGSRWATYDGHLYTFASDGCREGFLGAPQRYVVGPEPYPTMDEESLRIGVEWMARAVARHDGAYRMQRLQTARYAREDRPVDGWSRRLAVTIGRDGQVRSETTWTQDGAAGESTSWILHPTLEGATFVDEGDSAHAVTSPAQIEDLRRMAMRMPTTLLWNAGPWVVSYRGRSLFFDQEVVDVLLVLHDLQTTVHLDPDDARLVGITWRGRITDGATRRVQERFASFVDVDGIELPRERIVTVDGEEQPQGFGSWTQVELVGQQMKPRLLSEWKPNQP